MKFIPTELPGVVVIEPDVHRDERGFFLESYNAAKYREGGVDAQFVQDNHSSSRHGTLRGLHMQLEQPQGKLVRVIRGSVYDVAVDVRRGSPAFGRYFGIDLSDENHRQLYLPPGIAHGFAVTSETAEFEYKCTDFYHPASELTIRWDDPEIGIDWPLSDPILSPKDATGRDLADVLDVLPAFAGAD
jgi:dTDP-4-dehydrorhamnose 3,5-epimerase